MCRLRGYKLTEYRPDLPEPDNAGGGIIAEATLLLVHLSDIKGGVFLCLKISINHHRTGKKSWL